MKAEHQMSWGLRCGRLCVAQICFLLSIYIKELPSPWYSEPSNPTSLCLSTSPCSAFPSSCLSPVLATSKPHPHSSHMTGHVQERWLAQDTLTLLPLTHKILQASSGFAIMELLC